MPLNYLLNVIPDLTLPQCIFMENPKKEHVVVFVVHYGIDFIFLSQTKMEFKLGFAIVNK